MTRIFSLAALLATAMLAQDAYVKAFYIKWKPGKAQEGQRYVKDVVQKNALEWAKTDPQAIGQVTMTRVLPGGHEIPYDRLRLVFTSAPPDLGGNAGPGTRNTPEVTQMLGTLTTRDRFRLVHDVSQKNRCRARGLKSGHARESR